MKKLLALTLVLALALPLAALPETAAPAPAVTAAKVDTQGANVVEFARGIDAVIVEKDYLYGLMDFSGQTLVPISYGRMIPKEEGYFEVINENGFNNHALINAKNETIIPASYSDYNVLSADWAVAIALEVTTGEDPDYKSFFGGDAYNIREADIYNPATGAKLGSLTRAQYRDARVMGGYLLVSDRDRKVSVYDSAMALMPNSRMDSLYSAEFFSKDGGAYSSLTGEALEGGYTSAQALGGNLLVQDQKEYAYGVIDREGQALLPPTYKNVYVNGDYARVSTDEGSGLINERGEVVVAPEYDDIHTYTTSVGTYFFTHGYALVEKGGLLGFVDESGKVTAEIKAPSTALKLGAALAIPEMTGGLYLYAGDGALTKTDFLKAEEYRGNGHVLVVQTKDELYALADWHGNVLIAGADSSYAFTLNPECTAVIYEGELYTIQ